MPCAAFALLAMLVISPHAAAMGFGSAPVVQPPAVGPTPAAANATATVTCSATDDVEVVSLRVRVSGGTLPGGAAVPGSTDVVAPIAIAAAASAQGSITWSTPAPGTYTVTCIAGDGGSTFGGPLYSSASAQVSVIQAAPPPVIDALSGAAVPLLPGQAASLSVAAHDPSGGALAYAWSASGGTLAAAGDTASWTAPSAPGSYAIQVTVTNDAGQSATASVSVPVLLAQFEGGIRGSLAAPARVAASATGELHVVDSRDGRLLFFTPRGDFKFAAPLQERVLAVTSAPNALYASTQDGQILELDPQSGARRRALPVRIEGAYGMAWEASQARLWIAQKHGDRAIVLQADGTVAGQIFAAGTTPLAGPVDVAVDAAASVVWVAQESNETGHLAHAFKADGTYLRSVVGFGGGLGNVTRAGGIAVDGSGRLYVSDLFQGVVQVVASTGEPVATVGEYGEAPGQLKNPAGLGFMANGDLLVANLGAGRVERFGRNAPLPVCPGDSDCDGLPDWWELAHGLNPSWAGDAALDLDGDGLSNLAEFALGTDPRKWDTDGDGFSDGQEALAGFDPLDPNDHRPLVAALGAKESGPGLAQVGVAVTARNDAACSVSWTQTAGPAVRLRDERSATPTFVARAAGVYQFRAKAICGALASDAVVAEARIVEVAPRPETGGAVRVVRAGQWFALDGSFSSDANGGPIALGWDQTLGPASGGPTAGARMTSRAGRPGLSTFTLTATDSSGAAASSDVSLLVVDGRQPAPTAQPASPLLVSVGDAVVLDASDSLWPAAEPGASGGTPWFLWTQVDGPTRVVLDAADSARPSFTAPHAGRYSFEVALADGVLRSPPARVEVFVSEQGRAFPTASATSPGAVRVGDVAVLDGSASRSRSGAGLAYAWRQVSGPAAGLTNETDALATVVPFDPGFYEFELTVADGSGTSVPARVSLFADAATKDRVVAKATGPGVVPAGATVRLVGEAAAVPPLTLRWVEARSSELPVRYRWSQVAGPWIVLEEDEGPRPSFRPRIPGLYSFDLVVESGAERSAPARVSVLVTGTGG